MGEIKSKMIIGAVYKIVHDDFQESNPMILRVINEDGTFLFEPRFFNCLVPVDGKKVREFILINKGKKYDDNKREN